jgi:hypothetical protein
MKCHRELQGAVRTDGYLVSCTLRRIFDGLTASGSAHIQLRFTSHD